MSVYFTFVVSLNRFASAKSTTWLSKLFGGRRKYALVFVPTAIITVVNICFTTAWDENISSCSYQEMLGANTANLREIYDNVEYPDIHLHSHIIRTDSASHPRPFWPRHAARACCHISITRHRAYCNGSEEKATSSGNENSRNHPDIANYWNNTFSACLFAKVSTYCGNTDGSAYSLARYASQFGFKSSSVCMENQRGTN